MNDYLALLLGVISAAAGGELFVRGAVGIAQRLRVSAAVIGVTVAAFGTSGPELFVGITSGLAGTPQISLGDALGSNVVNIALVLGLALVIGEMRGRREDSGRNYWAALLAPFLVGALAFDGFISRTDGFIFITVFVLWCIEVVVRARRERSEVVKEKNTRDDVLAAVYTLVGLAFMVIAGRLIVTGGTGIAADLGVPPLVVGAIIVALGTSVPELATVLISRIKGHDEIGLNTLFGSNVFNGLLIVGVAAAIHPIAFVRREVMMALLVGVLAVMLAIPSRSGVLRRTRGVALLALYVLFVLTTIVYR